MSYETAEVLDSAADIIERDGHHKGDYAAPASDGDPLGGRPVCAMGALYVASGVTANWSAYSGAWIVSGDFPVSAEHALSGVLPGTRFIPHWNDAPERTQQEVEDTLRAAAKEQRLAADRAARGES